VQRTAAGKVLAGRLAIRIFDPRADKAHIGVDSSVPASVPKLNPRSIKRQPTPSNEPTKNGPEIVNFRPVL
jgi:hypothetical protein